LEADLGAYPLVLRLKVLSGFSISGGFSYQKYTYTLQRTIPSVRSTFISSSPHHSRASTGIL